MCSSLYMRQELKGDKDSYTKTAGVPHGAMWQNWKYVCVCVCVPTSLNVQNCKSCDCSFFVGSGGRRESDKTTTKQNKKL